MNGRKWLCWARNPPNSQPTQTGLKTTMEALEQEQTLLRRKQAKPPPVAPLSPPTHSYMAAVAARAGAARAGFRRMFSVSAFAPPPPPAARPAAEPCNNLFVSGNSPSRVSPLSPYSCFFLCVLDSWLLDINYLQLDVWKAKLYTFGN